MSSSWGLHLCGAQRAKGALDKAGPGLHSGGSPPGGASAPGKRGRDGSVAAGGGQEDKHMHKELRPEPNYYSCAIQSANIPHAFQRPSLHISLQHSQLMREQIKLSLLWFNSVIKELQEATGSK